jgi:uncharacterized protein YlzI (FlbEa/FlbD family)
MNNFIKLTTLDKGTTLVLNSTFIQSIQEQKNGSYIRMAFKETYSHYEVKETIEEIMKKIDKGNWFTTTTK